ncbi:carboxypeptidase N subunit 2-like [Chironomus tepperi]|uniref:carboxypeptidase N subunit 2-like n=1 Tax=Chironomus tepperi TaxID=113505 RepID=UPI00391F9A07
MLLINLTFLAILTFQLTSISQAATITATCIYSYDPNNTYTCDLHNTTGTSPTDLLEITGTHLTGRSDDDVNAVTCISGTEYFNGEVFRKFRNLKSLYLSSRQLEGISSNAFDVCDNLEYLLLRIGFGYPALPAEMLKNCAKLKILYLDSNLLTELPENLFGPTSSLEELYINNNKLSVLPENLLKNMENLQIVHINDNYFAELDRLAKALDGHANLRILELQYNRFGNFDFKFFKQFQKLESLTIGSQTAYILTQISWQSLPSSLTALTVHGVGEEIPENAFVNLVDLTSLEVNGRDIKTLKKDTFKALTKLESISVTNAGIKSLHAELFINNVNLVNLDFERNEIEELPGGIFTNLVNLGTGFRRNGLKFAWNNITRLNANSFGQHPMLGYLDFYRNQINEIERGIFSRFNTTIRMADFMGNVCIDEIYYNEITNLDADPKFLLCFNNWAGITTTTTTTTTTTQPSPTTTPGGAGHNFKRFEILGIIFVGFFAVLRQNLDF